MLHVMVAEDLAEWLEPDGLGGFAMGTDRLECSRRYHGLLVAAAAPPDDRMVLVNGLEIWIDLPSGSFALSSQRYAPDVRWPDGADRIERFEATPWPTWTFALPGLELVQEAAMVHGESRMVLRWRIDRPIPGARLRVRPLMSGRGYHALHHENSAFDFAAEGGAGTHVFRPYPGVPAVTVASNGDYSPAPLWFRNFFYRQEAERGLDCIEDLASPGEYVFDLSTGRPAAMILSAGERQPCEAGVEAERSLAQEATRRARRGSRLDVSAQAYVVTRGAGRTVFAGYPWFTDWGRDSFVAMRGLLIARGALGVAQDILATWAGFVSQGMIPNRFVDEGPAQYNSVDASLWFVVAAHDLFEAARRSGAPLEKADAVAGAAEAIIENYARGTRYGIGADADGLLLAGRPDVALTWMDARVDGRPVTPRIGKPVEVQALWINALRISARWTDRWRDAASRARGAFEEKFPRSRGGLFDVVDADRAPGRSDASVRPNQIFAVGGLPFATVAGATARAVVEETESELLTPLGLRTLSPRDPAYVPRYEGGPAQRDASYHQGAAWPWLMGAFVDAWLKTRADSPEAVSEARERFLAPLTRHLEEAGLGHVSELADGQAPHRPRGCPFQAWSLGELLRIEARLAPSAVTERSA